MDQQKQEAYRLLKKASELIEQARQLSLDDWAAEHIDDAYVAVELALDAIDGHVLARMIDTARLEMWNTGASIPGDRN